MKLTTENTEGTEEIINDGGPAFPAPAGVSHIISIGMSLHDWYCGMALQAIIDSANSMSLHQQIEVLKKVGGTKPFAKLVAMSANIYADAMIAVREERTKK